MKICNESRVDRASPDLILLNKEKGHCKHLDQAVN